LFAPDVFERAHRCPARLSIALLKLVDRSLRETDAIAQFGLTPAQDSARQSDLGRGSVSFELDYVGEIAGVICTQMDSHCAAALSKKKYPRR
jgi:hypothetical protein